MNDDEQYPDPEPEEVYADALIWHRMRRDSFREKVLKELHKRGARITGSYARGDSYHGSDYDFYMAPKAFEAFARWVKKQGLVFDSVIVGHISFSSIDCGRLIEVSTIFNRQRGQEVAKTVEIEGLTFRTW